MKFAQRPRRALMSGYRTYRNRLTGVGAPGTRPRMERVMEKIDLFAVDHGIFRLAYLNLHEIAPGVWRSAQPGPRDIRKLAKRGIRTVVNLRGARDCGSYRLEQRSCARYGVDLINFKMRSRGVPRPDTIRAAAALFEQIRYPALFHCKSGADRAGIMAALYLLLHEGRHVEEAARQLSLRYGHFRQADTGVLDHFLEAYRVENARAPIGFQMWAEERYDPDAVTRGFKAGGITNFIVNRVLKRE